MNSSVKAVPAEASATGNVAAIGAVLLEQGKLTVEDAERVMRLQHAEGIRFGEAAKLLGLISDADIDTVLARQFDYPYMIEGEILGSDELVAAHAPFSKEAEQIRAIRSQLVLRWFGRGQRILFFAAPAPGSGASWLTANLAIAFAQLGQATLLIDANLRSPRQHTMFQLGERAGLSDILAGRAGLHAVADIASFSNLSILTAGTPAPNPQELLSRAQFVRFSHSLADRFDVVLVDVSAFSVAADALTLATQIGGGVLVARKGHSRRGELSAASAMLASADCEVVGSVLLDF